MICLQYDFGTPQFDEGLAIRDLVLRKPLGMQFHESDIAKEWEEHHFGIFNADFQMQGTLSLKVIDGGYKMRQVAILPTKQGLGLGKKLIEFVEDWVSYQTAKTIELHARDYAIAFYKKLGYLEVGKPFQEVNMDHMKMVKKL